MSNKQQHWCNDCKRWEAEYILPRTRAYLDTNEIPCNTDSDDERMPVMARKV